MDAIRKSDGAAVGSWDPSDNCPSDVPGYRRALGCQPALRREQEQLEFEIGPHVVSGDAAVHPPAGEALDRDDEAALDSVMERAASLVDHRVALQLDQRLLDVGVDVAEQAGECVSPIICERAVPGARPW